MPRKEQRPCDDRNVAWATDKGRFGFQMLEKMGWKEGKGLGANEDGTTEHIKVKKKIDNQGIGTETVTHNKNWLETSVAYESILASLNASYGTKPDTTEEKEKPAEKPKGVVGRPRKVLYSRMLRAKDLANYSSEDKSAIFGGVPYGVAAAAQEEKATTTAEEVKVQEVGSESEGMEEEESDKKKSKKSADTKEEEDKGEEDEDKETDTVSGVTTTTSAVSLQDYFKMKMAEMARKRGGDVSAPQVSVAVESRQSLQAVASTANEKAEKKDKKKRKREEEEEETTEEPKKDKKDKKKTKKRKQEESDAGKSKKEDEKKKNKKKKSKKSKKGEDEQTKKKEEKKKSKKKASS